METGAAADQIEPLAAVIALSRHFSLHEDSKNHLTDLPMP
jgi:hypothetical protein